jgi:long-chain acyl-CoA synthetase
MDPIQRHASERGDAPALIQGERVVTWNEFDERSNQVARALARLGVGPDDRVAVALRNSVEFAELIGGAGRLGATVTPVSFRFKRDEVDYMVNDAKAKVVVAEPANAAEFAGLPHTIFRGEAYDAWVGAEDPSALTDQVGTGLAPLRYYTSGTTGRPKAVVRKENPARAALAMQVGQRVMTDRLGVVAQPGEVYLLAAVIYHTAPGTYFSMGLGWGHTAVIMDHFDPEEALQLIERHRVTWTQIAPIHLVRIVGLPEETQRRYDLSSMKRVLHAGAPCPVDVKWKALDLFPEGSIYEYYGATEGLATECTTEEWRRKPGTVGRPIGGITVRILDDVGRELPANEVGEVYIDNGMRFEYEGDPEKTAETWRGLPLPHGSQVAHDHLRRRQHLSRGGREHAVRASRGRRCRGDRRARRRVRGAGQSGRRGTQPRHRDRAVGVLPRSSLALQVPEVGRLRRHDAA